MTRTELRTLVRSMTGLDTEDTLINQGLEFGMNYLGGQHDFRQMIFESDLTTVAATASIALPTNTHHIIEARFINDTNSYTITLKPKKWLVLRYPNISSRNNSKPTMAYKEGSNLYLYPIPDDAYTIRVTVAIIPDMDGDSDDSDIALIDYPLACWAAGFVFDALQRWDSGWRSTIVWYTSSSSWRYQLSSFPNYRKTFRSGLRSTNYLFISIIY